jgi:hypothetical protein
MKVYIILDEPDEFGFRVFVKKVFSDKEKAIDYVYADLIKQPHYKCKCKQDIIKSIEFKIHEAEIE